MPLEWSLLVSFCIFLIYLCLFFIWHNLAPMSIILCCFELGGVWGCVCVCVCVWVHCFDVGLGREGSGLGLLFFLCCVWVGVGICLKKCPVFETSFFYCTCCHFCIVFLVPLVVWLVKYLGWAFVAAAAFQHLFLVLCYINFLPFQVSYFRALPHSLGYLYQYSFLSLMILNIMHHAVIEYWKWEGDWWYPLYFFQ